MSFGYDEMDDCHAHDNEGPEYEPGEIRDDELPDILRNAVKYHSLDATFVNACLLAADQLEEFLANQQRKPPGDPPCSDAS